MHTCCTSIIVYPLYIHCKYSINFLVISFKLSKVAISIYQKVTIEFILASQKYLWSMWKGPLAIGIRMLCQSTNDNILDSGKVTIIHTNHFQSFNINLSKHEPVSDLFNTSLKKWFQHSKVQCHYQIYISERTEWVECLKIDSFQYACAIMASLSFILGIFLSKTNVGCFKWWRMVRSSKKIKTHIFL